jgi:branched-chain amino acid transport system ATP-binding protein
VPIWGGTLFLLKIENLHSGYNGVEVLHGVSLIINEGDIVSLVGLNGAGKSTLLRTISGMLKIDTGKLFFQEKEITSLSPDQLVQKGIVHVPESRLLFPQLTVQENLLLGTASKGNHYRRENLRERYDFVYEFFPILKQRLTQRAGTLSGGEQQMLAIGRGLMSNPKLLLLDEPSLGLAPIVVEKIFDVLKHLNKEGLTVFVVEQNVSMALGFSNQAYVLDLGRVIIKGSGSDLLKDPRIQEVYLGGFELKEGEAQLS